MTPKTTKILLVEDNPGDARLFREMLVETGDRHFEINWVTSLSQAMASLAGGGIDLIILDLGLPDSQGLDTFTRAYQHGTHLPFLVLTGQADETLGVTAVRQGAQDYLVKGEVNSSLLSRAIRYAIERKRTEAALEAERRKLFTLLNNLPAVVHLKNEDYKIIFANRLFREVFDDPGDRPCYEFIHGRNTPCEDCSANKVLETQVPQKIERSEPFKGRIYEFYNYPFCASDGSRLVLTLGIDITERKQAEEALRQSESAYRLLFETMLQGVVYQDAEGKIISMNPAAERILGKNPAEFLGETSLTVEHHTVRADGSPSPGLEHPSIMALRTGQEVRGVVMGVYNPREQDYRWININAVPLIREPDLRPSQVYTVFEDITERKRTEEVIKEREEQLATIYENAPLIMMLVDRDCRVRKVNKLAEQFTGAAAADLLDRRGGEALRCLHALDDPQGCGFGPHCQYCPVRLTVLETFETGRSRHQVEASLPFPIAGNAQEVTFLLCTARLFVQGRPQVLVTIQDISTRKQAERKLRESEQNLRYLASQLLTAQERERRRISRELHDELGHALLTLKLNLRSIERALHPDQQALAEEIESLFHYIDEVIDNVRRLYLDLTPGDIEDLGLTAALQTLIDEFAKNNRKIQWSVNLIDIDSQFPLPGQTAIYRIFQEILTNIGKHAHPSQVSVSIHKDDKWVFFAIEDNGQGFQGDQAQTYVQKGMGLLAMEERVRMLGGSLEVRGQKDHGTRVTFSIPIAAGGKLD